MEEVSHYASVEHYARSMELRLTADQANTGCFILSAPQWSWFKDVHFNSEQSVSIWLAGFARGKEVGWESRKDYEDSLTTGP